MNRAMITRFILDHVAWLGFWVVLAVINSMPTPTEKDSAAYRHLFNVLHVLVAGLMRVGEIRRKFMKVFGLGNECENQERGGGD